MPRKTKTTPSWDEGTCDKVRKALDRAAPVAKLAVCDEGQVPPADAMGRSVIVPGATYERCSFSQMDVTGRATSRAAKHPSIEFVDCTFSSVGFQYWRYKGDVRFRRCTFEDCTFDQCSTDGGLLFDGCQLRSVSFYRNKGPVELFGCTGVACSFAHNQQRKLSIKETTLRNSLFRDQRFSKDAMDGATFIGCRFTHPDQLRAASGAALVDCLCVLPDKPFGAASSKATS